MKCKGVKLMIVSTSAVTKECFKEEEPLDKCYIWPYSVQVTKEMPNKIGDIEELVMVLIDHGSNINLLWTKFYQKGS